MIENSWIWNGILILFFFGLMFLVMWITDEGIELIKNKTMGLRGI